MSLLFADSVAHRKAVSVSNAIAAISTDITHVEYNARVCCRTGNSECLSGTELMLAKLRAPKVSCFLPYPLAKGTRKQRPHCSGLSFAQSRHQPWLRVARNGNLLIHQLSLPFCYENNNIVASHLSRAK